MEQLKCRRSSNHSLSLKPKNQKPKNLKNIQLVEILQDDFDIEQEKMKRRPNLTLLSNLLVTLHNKGLSLFGHFASKDNLSIFKNQASQL